MELTEREYISIYNRAYRRRNDGEMSTNNDLNRDRLFRALMQQALAKARRRTLQGTKK